MNKYIILAVLVVMQVPFVSMLMPNTPEWYPVGFLYGMSSGLLAGRLLLVSLWR